MFNTFLIMVFGYVVFSLFFKFFGTSLISFPILVFTFFTVKKEEYDELISILKKDVEIYKSEFNILNKNIKEKVDQNTNTINSKAVSIIRFLMLKSLNLKNSKIQNLK